MHLALVENHGKKTIVVREYAYEEKDGGERRRVQRVVKSLGSLEKYDEGDPGYFERLKESFKRGEPLIPELKAYCGEEGKEYISRMKKGSPACVGHARIYAHKFLERFLEELRLNTLFASYKAQTDIEYDVYGFFKLLLFGRILSPASKIATARQNKAYYDPPLGTGKVYEYNVYDTLTFMHDHKAPILGRVRRALDEGMPRRTSLVFYDVTNAYFEISDPDPDTEDGKKGLRKMGVSKEERTLPIVQIGLFMDDHGMPLSYGIFPGNTLDHQTFVKALKESAGDLPCDRFVMVGDRGMFTYRNVMEILDTGNGYIVSKSLNGTKVKKEERDWAYSDEGYKSLSDDFRYKSRVTRTMRPDGKGGERLVEEKAVVYWSGSVYRRGIEENKRFIDFLDRLLLSPNSFRITSQQNKSVRRFLDPKRCVDVKTGEIKDSSDLRLLVDEDKVAEWKNSLGYFQIVTSETDMDDLEIIEKYHGLKQIEDLFRIMKSSLEIRPMYVRTPEHIDAHVLTCVLACTVIRLIQKRVYDYRDREGLLDDKERALHWSYGISAGRISAALNKWKVVEHDDVYYKFMDIDDPDLSLILKAFGIEIPLDLFTKKDLRTLKTGFKIFPPEAEKQ